MEKDSKKGWDTAIGGLAGGVRAAAGVAAATGFGGIFGHHAPHNGLQERPALSTEHKSDGLRYDF